MRFLFLTILFIPAQSVPETQFNQAFDQAHFGAPGSTATDIQEGKSQLEVKFRRHK
jgi:hypothetical protein